VQSESALTDHGDRAIQRANLSAFARAALAVVMICLAALLIGVMLVEWHSSARLAVDLKLTSAQRLVHGETLYPTEGRAAGGYPYPPLWAFLVTPLLLLPAAAAEYSAAVICVVLMLAALWIVGTRDPACYAIALWSASVVALARTCNASALVAPLIALGYRWNSAPTGIAVALKLYAWPLLLWGGVTRGRRDLVIGIGAAAAAIFVPWAAIGFDGVTRYVSVARGITEATQGSTYALPLPLSITITALALAGMWVRRRDAAGSFAFGVLAMLAATPVLWDFYFSAIFVPLALQRPRASVAWFVPLAMWWAPDALHVASMFLLLAWLGIAAPAPSWSIRQMLSARPR
jgi:hypothetical protein